MLGANQNQTLEAARRFLSESDESRARLALRMNEGQLEKLLGQIFAFAWLDRDELRLEDESIERFFDPASRLIASVPLIYFRALLRVATSHPEIVGWQRDTIYEQVDCVLDGFFGLNFGAVERKISGQTESRFGPAAWSEANLESGWLTNYADFYFVMEELKLVPGQTLLDIGSGHGRTGFLIGLLRPELNYLGYEIVIERALESQALGARFPNVKFFCEDVAALREWPKADIYYLYDALNEATARLILDRIASAQGRLVVRDGKGTALGLLKSDRRFRRVAAFERDERLYQAVSIFETR